MGIPNTPPFEAGNKRGRGRPLGTPNKFGQLLKDMILEALDRAGQDKDGKGAGVDYLVEQAHKNPVAFMGLVGKVLPLQITGANGGPVEGRTEHVITFDGNVRRIE